MYQSGDEINSESKLKKYLLTEETSHQRAGKWKYDEEIYAEHLIQSFRMGNLNDCSEGQSLRSYLSKKLNCSRMRISKKFAGRLIGKVITVSFVFLKILFLV